MPVCPVCHKLYRKIDRRNPRKPEVATYIHSLMNDKKEVSCTK